MTPLEEVTELVLAFLPGGREQVKLDSHREGGGSEVISMGLFLSIRALYEEGVAKKAIARRLGIDRRTVRKYLRRIEAGAVEPGRARVPSKLDHHTVPPYKLDRLVGCHIALTAVDFSVFPRVRRATRPTAGAPAAPGSPGASVGGRRVGRPVRQFSPSVEAGGRNWSGSPEADMSQQQSVFGPMRFRTPLNLWENIVSTYKGVRIDPTRGCLSLRQEGQLQDL